MERTYQFNLYDVLVLDMSLQQPVGYFNLLGIAGWMCAWSLSYERDSTSCEVIYPQQLCNATSAFVETYFFRTEYEAAKQWQALWHFNQPTLGFKSETGPDHVWC